MLINFYLYNYMPRLNILSLSEQKEFDNPRKLSGEERKLYFRLNTSIRELILPIKDHVNKVAFTVMAYHFKISKKFFLNYDTKDIEYVLRQLGITHFDHINHQLDNKTFHRYKVKILEYMGYQAFDSVAKSLIRTKAYNLAMQYTRPKVIFNDCIELLLEQKVEVPRYNTLRTIISNVLHQYKNLLLKILEENLSAEDSSWLDELLLLDEEKSVYKLTSLKAFYQSVKPKEIRVNTKSFAKLQEMHDKVCSIVRPLPINTKGIEYYATIVIKSDIFRIKRRESRDRYLHLIAFIIYQYARLHDTLMEIWMKAVSSFNNSSKREHKERCYEFRYQHETKIKNYMENVQQQNQGIKDMYSVYKEELVNVSSKYNRICKILDKLVDTIKIVDEHLIKERVNNDSEYFKILEKKSRSLQSKLTPILKVLKFDQGNTPASSDLKQAIEYFQEKNGSLSTNLPMKFLNEEEIQEVTINEKVRTSLYKALLFRKITDGVKSGTLNLESSYKFRALDEYMIPKDEWEKDKILLLKQANLERFSNYKKVLNELKKILDQDYITTNENVLNGKNQYIKIRKVSDFVINTPAVETEKAALSDYLPGNRIVPIQEVLSTVNSICGFLKSFEYYKITHKRDYNTKLMLAGIMSLGYGMKDSDIAIMSKGMSASALENIVSWCFTTDNIRNGIDEILKLTEETGIPKLYMDNNSKVHTSSDGQKWKVMYDSLNANYSFKYYGKDQGSTVASFIDKRHLLFYSTVMSPVIREAAYVIDGLMNNSVVKSDIHSTDTHGYSEVVFAVTHMLSILYAPRIKGIKHQILSTFSSYKAQYKVKGYNIVPRHTLNTNIIEQLYDDMLRFVATIKLKRSTASQLLSRLNSYSKQHKLYQAIKEFGKIIKSIFLLQYIDNLKLRQSIEKQLNLIEHNNKFSKAIAQENEPSFIQQTQEEQIVAESCRRLIKAAIICWNCLYLRKQLDEELDATKRKALIQHIKNGSIMIWKHINLKGEYDFSYEKIKDKFGLKLDYSTPLHFA